jgi:spore germination protein YaaH
MSEKSVNWTKLVLPLALGGLIFLIAGGLQALAPKDQAWLIGVPQASSQNVAQHLLRGKAATLSWIVGRDCRRGLQAYLQSAATHPDAALVGTGWVNADDGTLISGSSNNCTAGTLSMDSVVKQIHDKGGMAYLTITMVVDGSGDSYTPQQQSAYIEKAIKTPEYINLIVQEVQRAGYDGVIMDLESANADYPNIQQLFALYNQKLWDALRTLQKPYGIALVHKLSDHDEAYFLNGFQDWQALSHSADFLIVMAVDQSYRVPGPTVSVPWLKQLLAYAQKKLPDFLSNLVWELPLYGAKWRQQGNGWVYEGMIDYLEARQIVESASNVDEAASNLKDPTAAHLVYTDSAGVKRAIWYHTAQNLASIITEFRQTLEQVPQLKNSHLQVAVWYRQTSEPGEVWSLWAPLLPNA